MQPIQGTPGSPDEHHIGRRTIQNAVSEATGEGESHLKAYTQAKNLVARELRSAAHLLKTMESTTRFQQCRELIRKVADDQFNLVVLGQFKRGKSSLMNAILGRELLPTGHLPLTSAVTVLRFGSQERLLVQREGSMFPEEAPVSCLVEYATQKGNPGNCKNVARVYVELPHPFLRRGLQFVDTPGVGSVIEANTRTTYSFLPQCDAVIFVTSVESPISQAELQFLHAIREHAQRTFFVVNKIDLLPDGQQDDVLGFVRETLDAEFGEQRVRLYALSAKQGLDGKLSGDVGRYAHSGLEAFEEELTRWLTEEKAQAFLLGVLDRVLRLLEGERIELELSLHARGASEGGGDRRRAIRDGLLAFRHRRDRHFEAGRQRIEKWVKGVVGPGLDPLLSREVQSLLSQIRDALDGEGWRPSGRVVEEVRQRCTGALHERVASYLSDKTESARSEFESIVEDEWAGWERLLDSVPAATATALGLSVHETHAEARSCSTPSGVQWAQPRLRYQTLQVQTSGLYSILPVWMSRGKLERALGDGIRSLAQSYREAAIHAFNDAVRSAFDQVVHKAEQQAAELEQRLTGGRERKAPDSKETVEALREAAKSIEGHISALAKIREDLAERGLECVSSRPQPRPPVSEAETFGRFRESVAGGAPFDPAQMAQTRGCPICDHVFEWVVDFLSRWQYAFATDEGAQQGYARGPGFCALHTWQLGQMASPRGLCSGYPARLERVARELKHFASLPPEEASSRVRSLAPDRAHCPLCRMVCERESQCVSELLHSLESPQGRDVYARSQGLCLPHLRLALTSETPPDIAAMLLAHAAERLETMAEDMASYALKFDATRRELQTRDEQDVCRRVLVHLVGDRGLSSA